MASLFFIDLGGMVNGFVGGRFGGFVAENFDISWVKLEHLLGVSLGGFLGIGGFSGRGASSAANWGLIFLGLVDFLEDFARPLCFIKVRDPPIFTNSCRL